MHLIFGVLGGLPFFKGGTAHMVPSGAALGDNHWIVHRVDYLCFRGGTAQMVLS